ITATLFFTISWSGAHTATALQSGILPQTMFPAVVGLFTFAVVRYGPPLQRSLVSFFDVRDRYPMKLRFGVAILVPFLASLLITFESRVSQTALKEQVVVVISLVTGYLAMAPRSGDLLAAVKDLVPARAQRQ
ncbi:MAG: hypothetical protein AAB289_08890, partial [Chloroflexota bacterium]